MYAFLNRSETLATCIAIGSVIVLLAFLPGPVVGAAAGVDLSSVQPTHMHQDTVAPAELPDPPIYPGSGRTEPAKKSLEECEDCLELPEVAVSPADPLSTGGPDEHGYSFTDSNEVGGPSYNFVDIRWTGSTAALFDDDYDGPFDIGFDFPFYGEVKKQFYIGSNGLIGFSPDALDRNYGDCPIVAQFPPNDIIALMWDDLVVDYYGAVQYQTFDMCPYGGSEACLVVQYSDMFFYSGTPAGTFQTILFENSDILIQFADAGYENGVRSVTGIENSAGDDGLTYACFEYDSLSDELAILFSRLGLGAAKTVDGSLPAPGEQVTFTIEVENGFDAPVSNIVIDDLLPPDVEFRGPVTLSPDHPEASLAQSAADLPRLVSNLTLAKDESVIVTLPTTVTAGIAGARLNQALVTMPGMTETVSAVAGIHVMPDCEAIATNVVQNCSFETGDLSGWMTTDVISPLLPIQVARAGVDTRYGQFTSDPVRGDYAVVHGFDGDGPGVIELAQDIVLPGDAASVEFAYRVGYDLATFYPWDVRTFVVVVEPEGGGPYPLQESLVYIVEPGQALPDSDDLLGSVNVSDFAGKSVRLIFRWTVPESYSGPAMFQIDNVIVNKVSPPTFANSPRTSMVVGHEYKQRVVTSGVFPGESRELTAPVLPSWLQLVDNGDGSATLSGRPKMGDVGPHDVTIRVTDSRDQSAEQKFTITVVERSDLNDFAIYMPVIVD